MTKHIYCNVMTAGYGTTRLYAALNLSRNLHVLMTYKEGMDTCDSIPAQGGICMLRGEDGHESYPEDAMRAGHYENRKESVDLVIRISPGIIRYFLELGVGLDKDPDGGLKYTKEGAHSRPRIRFYEGTIGKVITAVLQEQTAVLPNVNIMEYAAMTDILIANGACIGILVRIGNGSTLFIHARDTVMTTGGIGRPYQHSTNFSCLTDGTLTVIHKHGVKLEHLDRIRIHPTSLYTEKPGKSFLIPESARGEGAVLPNGKRERFVNELLLGGAASQAIKAEVEKEGSRYVWLFFAPTPHETIQEYFPHIYETCLEEGCNITREPILVALAQHCFVNGVWMDLDSKTATECLYTMGETSYSEVHRKNHLVSSGLLESLVFVEKAAKRIGNS